MLKALAGAALALFVVYAVLVFPVFFLVRGTEEALPAFLLLLSLTGVVVLSTLVRYINNRDRLAVRMTARTALGQAVVLLIGSLFIFLGSVVWFPIVLTVLSVIILGVLGAAVARTSRGAFKY